MCRWCRELVCSSYEYVLVDVGGVGIVGSVLRSLVVSVVFVEVWGMIV